jgi:uncharacterized protein
MQFNHAQETFEPAAPSARADALMKAAHAAARAIPPAFPLNATVAVNPFLGQTGESLPAAAARLARVAGIRVTRSRADYAALLKSGRMTADDIESALAATIVAARPSSAAGLRDLMTRPATAPRQLPSLAELVAGATGTDWPAVIARTFGLWAAGHFDQGQALWSPTPERSAFAAWREWATHDLTPELAGLTGFSAHVAAAPDDPERAILRAAATLDLSEASAETVFHRLLIDVGGWAQHARWLSWQAELGNRTDDTIIGLLAIRLVWEEALLKHRPDIEGEWRDVVAAHAAPLVPSADDAADAVFQLAAEHAHQRSLAALLEGPRPKASRPVLQAVFCIDVRSEVFRRALESLDPGIATIGFAGFFGLTLSHMAQGTDQAESHLPVLLTPGLYSCSHAESASEQATRISARTLRAWDRFRQAAISSFAFVEAAGPAYAFKLVRDALGAGAAENAISPAPRIIGGMSAADKAATGAAVLKAMSLSKGHAPLVLLLGHGARVTNNPHRSAYHCGACGGQTGEVSARMLALLLNDPETRAGLPAHGVDVPSDTVFIAGLHETTTDTVTLYRDSMPPLPMESLAKAERWLAQAAASARAERAMRLPGATAGTIGTRALNWAETRPEWGLAGCSAFIAAPREATSTADFKGRAFLHSYDWRQDAGFGTLELIITAPVVVASWISLQYYGSAVAPDVFGGGNKLIHNVVGGIGVLQGNGGTLRPGLPWQTIHDGMNPAHEPLRLSVLIEAPRDAILDVLAKHEGVRQLFDNGWLHLFTLEEGRMAARYLPSLAWQDMPLLQKAA